MHLPPARRLSVPLAASHLSCPPMLYSRHTKSTRMIRYFARSAARRILKTTLSAQDAAWCSMARRNPMAAACAAAIALPLAVLFLFNPATTRFFPPCPVHCVTGFYCPGCGSLRAMHNLLHGHLVEAMSRNPLMVVSIPIVALMSLNPSWIYRKWVPWTAMAVLIGYGILRNMPLWPFVLMAP
ncbi:MAG: DUF2752 domain-containing protein [Kiritimatiellia bacterium]